MWCDSMKAAPARAVGAHQRTLCQKYARSRLDKNIALLNREEPRCVWPILLRYAKVAIIFGLQGNIKSLLCYVIHDIKVVAIIEGPYGFMRARSQCNHPPNDGEKFDLHRIHCTKSIK